MTSLKWSNEYNTGDENIDGQHKYLFDLANQIIDPHNDFQATHHNFLVLYHFLKEHFHDEEEFMEKCGFLEVDEHKKEHELLLTELDEISQEIIRGDMNSDKIITFMRNWLFDHFLQKDMLIGKYLNKQ